MKKYIAIGHWDGNENITSVAHSNNTLKDFRDDLGGNGFIPWIILTEKSFSEIVDSEADADLVWQMITKKVANYRKWNEVNDYIAQCLDIMEEKMAAA